MEIDGNDDNLDDEPPDQATESLDEFVPAGVTKPISAEEEQIWKLIRRYKEIQRKNMEENIPVYRYNSTEGGLEAETDDPVGSNMNENNDGNPESRREVQQDEPQPGGQEQQQPEEAQPNLPPFLMNEDRLDEDEVAELQNRLSTLIVAQALARYRAQGVPEDDLEVILIPHTAGGNFISRGAWFGSFVLLSVLVLFLLQMQAMVGFISQPVDVTFDELMNALLEVRRFDSHVRKCHKDKSSMLQDVISSSPFSTDGDDCNRGVLHIPALQVLRDEYPLDNYLMPYRQGINLTWRMPCQTHNRALQRPNDESCSAAKETGVCAVVDTLCFRGVHDKIVPGMEIGNALRFAKELIRERNDHFDVYLAGRLEEKLPGVVQKLRALLADVYSVHQIEPFAFRLLSVGPMDGFGVDPRNPYLNHTNYKRWVKRNKARNDRAKPSIPWPFRGEPVRDQCLLLSDLEADSKFSIYTSVLLTTGAGYDFRGGTTLFVDDEDSTLGPNRRSKIQRGLVIDGSEGRVVVSTGGLENRRCRLPLREGVRTELQIWWDSPSSG